MEQYKVLRHGYDQLLHLLETRGKQTNLFSLADGFSIPVPEKEPIIVQTDICDICQLQSDKTGQRIVVKDVLYDLPTVVVYIVGIHIYANSYSRSLEAAGSIIAFFKDNPVIPLDSFNWHGSTTKNLFIESVVRNPEPKFAQTNLLPAVHLQYKLEAGINSEKAESFKRVEKRDIRSKTINDKK